MLWRKIIDRYFIKQPRLRQFVTHCLYGANDRTIDLLGTQLRINTLLENGYYRAYRKTLNSSLLKEEFPVLCNLAHFASDGGAFVDAGANIGIYSGFFSRFSTFFGNFDVHAFEAAPSTFRRLEVNARNLGFHAHNIALARNFGQLRFVEGAVSHVATLVSKQNDYSIPGREFVVPAAPLDSFSIRSDNIVLKIDVEGQELDVLAGAEQFLAERRIRAVYCDGWQAAELPRYLERFGFQFYDGRTLRRCADLPWSLLALLR